MCNIPGEEMEGGSAEYVKHAKKVVWRGRVESREASRSGGPGGV
jgi:hypothetical protein